MELIQIYMLTITLFGTNQILLVDTSTYALSYNSASGMMMRCINGDCEATYTNGTQLRQNNQGLVANTNTTYAYNNQMQQSLSDQINKYQDALAESIQNMENNIAQLQQKLEEFEQSFSHNFD